MIEKARIEKEDDCKDFKKVVKGRRISAVWLTLYFFPMLTSQNILNCTFERLLTYQEQSQFLHLKWRLTLNQTWN